MQTQTKVVMAGVAVGLGWAEDAMEEESVEEVEMEAARLEEEFAAAMASMAAGDSAEWAGREETQVENAAAAREAEKAMADCTVEEREAEALGAGSRAEAATAAEGRALPTLQS